jgi:signal transduction histidine kinase
MPAIEAPGPVNDAPAVPGGESRRIAVAQERAAQRLRRQRDLLRPLGFTAIVVVATGTFGANPHPGLQGRALGVSLALVAFAGTLAVAIGHWVAERSAGFQAAVIAAMAATGVALVALQPQGTNELAGGVAVWMAVARLPLALGVALGAATAVALDAAEALSGSSSVAILAATLLLALLGLVAYFIKQSRASQDHTELLLAQLEDAREEQTRAAAVAERGRIATELHDVLAHSLSGAAIQLQAARKLAEREQATPPIRNAIDRAGELVKDGLANARQAVGALRGEELPGVGQLESLVTAFRDDTAADASLRIEGNVRKLPVEASLALYRGAQEALTNVARYAPGATTTVLLRYATDQTVLSIEDHIPPAGGSPSADGLHGVGGGRGLAGMLERIERVGGSASAGPTASGWRVELVVPS